MKVWRPKLLSTSGRAISNVGNCNQDGPVGDKDGVVVIDVLGRPKHDQARSADGGGVPARGPKFEERYARVTTYLENGLHRRVQELRRSGTVASVTALYNAVLAEYVGRHYGGGGN